MTSGAFAQASGLSRKALRLYDELGLLHPARVDPDTLYRFYHPGRLEQARLVAWLRRLGMPLAVIRSVSGLPPAQAAVELAAYWATVEAEMAARRELATFLIGYLSGKDPGKDTAMSDNQGTLTVRYGVRSDTGLHREDNEDAAYAGARLLAVADGMGGHAAGEVASAAGGPHPGRPRVLKRGQPQPTLPSRPHRCPGSPNHGDAHPYGAGRGRCV